jgi:hypothetical protein
MVTPPISDIIPQWIHIVYLLWRRSVAAPPGPKGTGVFDHKLAVVAEGHQMLSEKLDRVESSLGRKIDKIAGEVAAHRAFSRIFYVAKAVPASGLQSLEVFLVFGFLRFYPCDPWLKWFQS